MRFFLIAILLIFTACEDTMQKPPAIILFNPPEGANVEFPPTEILENGFIDGDPDSPLYAKNENAFEKQNSSWLKYLTTVTKQYYVSLTGSDDDGDGTEENPYLTVPKAYEQLIHGQIGEIILMDDGTYEIEENITTNNTKVYIHEAPGKFAVLKHKTYLNSDKNDFYKINLLNSCELRIKVTQYVLEDVNTGKATHQYACGIFSYSGVNKVDIWATNSGSGGIVLPTNKGTSLFPAIVKNYGVPTLAPFTAVSVAGEIITGENGYIFDTAEVPASLFEVATTMDYPEFWVENGVDRVKNTLISGAVIDADAGGTTLSIRGASKAISAGVGTEADSNLVDLLTDAYGGITGTDVAGFKTSTGGNLVSVAIAISGNSAKVIIGDIKSIADTTTYLEVEQGYIIKNMNLLTNIAEIK